MPILLLYMQGVALLFGIGWVGEFNTLNNLFFFCIAIFVVIILFLCSSNGLNGSQCTIILFCY